MVLSTARRDTGASTVRSAAEKEEGRLSVSDDR